MREMKLRLFLDEDDHMALAVALRKRGHDAVHALEEKRSGLADESQLTFAAAEERCLVSFNVGDFVRLHNRWLRKAANTLASSCRSNCQSENHCVGCWS